jgi:hypothetical protein
MIADELGEVSRDNWRGSDIRAENPTTHTMRTEDGGLLWTQVNEYGVDEYGPAYGSPGQQAESYCPEFGSTAEGSRGIGNPNNHGWPDDIPARNGEPESAPLPAEPDPNANDTVGEGGTDTSGGYDWASDPNPTDGSGDFGDDYGSGYGDDHGGGGSEYGCVAIGSFLPDGRTAGDIRVGDTMELGHQETMEPGEGVVSYSQLKEARGYRITTESGASLICSDTAPIPARDKGLLTPDKLLGEQVAVRWDEHGQVVANWETVTKVVDVGVIQIQHITVGDKCFWAGEKMGAYILHHNDKDDRGGYDDYWLSAYDPFKAELKPDQSYLTAHQDNHGGSAALMVAVAATPLVDGFWFA